MLPKMLRGVVLYFLWLMYVCRLRNNLESSFGVKNILVIETGDRDNVSLVTQLGNDAWVGNRGLKIRAAA